MNTFDDMSGGEYLALCDMERAAETFLVAFARRDWEVVDIATISLEASRVEFRRAERKRRKAEKRARQTA